MQIFTIQGGKAQSGATVGCLELSNGTKIPAIIIGEEGRGRKRAALPVTLNRESQAVWNESGSVVISFAKLGETKSGKPKLIQSDTAAEYDERFIAVFRTNIGYRGSNAHTGDRAENWTQDSQIYGTFPAESILEIGRIAQGQAGRMGSGEQLIAVMPKKTVFRTQLSGRMYGRQSCHYYYHNGEEVLSATWDERDAADMF